MQEGGTEMLIHVEFEEMPLASGTNLACYIVCEARFAYKCLRFDPGARGQLVDVSPTGPGAPVPAGTCALLNRGFIYNPAMQGIPPPARNSQFAFEIDPPPSGTVLEVCFGVMCPEPTDWTCAIRIDNGPSDTRTIRFQAAGTPTPGVPTTIAPYHFSLRVTA